MLKPLPGKLCLKLSTPLACWVEGLFRRHGSKAFGANQSFCLRLKSFHGSTHWFYHVLTMLFLLKESESQSMPDKGTSKRLNAVHYSHVL